MIIPFRRDNVPIALALLGAIGGAIAAWHYHRLGLTLSHYDARGHLVVARRVIDSITPGWQQFGAVWLPLPHLLNLVPVQNDVMYRTGASAVAISVSSFALSVGALAWIVQMLTGSALGAVAAAAVFALNPNVLYLQSTPMTEPLLLGLTTLAVALLLAWCRTDVPGSGRSLRTTAASDRSEPREVAQVGSRDNVGTIGWAFALACLTRYEAWPVTCVALAAAVWSRWRNGDTLSGASRSVLPIAVYPVLAVIGFAVFSRVVVGEWFVATGFFVPENKALGSPLLAAAEVWWGTRALSGYWVLVIGLLGLCVLAGGLFTRRGADALVALSLAAAAAVPWAAFVNGHPFRIRDMVPLVAIEAIGAGVAVARFRPLRAGAVLLLALTIAFELHPTDVAAPMVTEAQWDRPNALPRQRVTDCLRAGLYDGEKIMASMGSLGHYLQETSRHGFALRDFLHEGNGDIWLAALGGPRPYVGWVMIEEKAEGGDMLAKLARKDPHFLDGYSRVCDGAGLVLYKRTEGPTARFRTSSSAQTDN